ncbi:type II secretion system protein GspM [Legionella sp.]|uniref:type II secretion system protein GspM n=1 Tax=Legionella sp. TaxID=459 RepID=UPI003C814A70
MKTYLSNLNEREKGLIVGAVLCLVFYCYYSFLYLPLNHQVTQKSTQLAEKLSTLDWMRKIKQKKNTLKTKKTIDNSQLLTILATQLKEDSTLKFPYQLQQTSSGDVQLAFEVIPFNVFIAWFRKINEQFAINLKQFNAERTNTEGLAHVMVILSAVP